MTHGLDFRGRYVEIRVCIPRNPSIADLLSVYQCLYNETNASPRLQSIVAHEAFPLRAFMEDTQYAFIENVDRIQQLGHLQIATPLPLIPIHLSGVRSMAHGPRTSVATDYDNRSQAGVHSARENPLGLSPSDLTHNPQSRLRLETSATDVPKQQLNLVMRVS